MRDTFKKKRTWTKANAPNAPPLKNSCSCWEKKKSHFNVRPKCNCRHHRQRRLLLLLISIYLFGRFPRRTVSTQYDTQTKDVHPVYIECCYKRPGDDILLYKSNRNRLGFGEYRYGSLVSREDVVVAGRKIVTIIRSADKSSRLLRFCITIYYTNGF